MASLLTLAAVTLLAFWAMLVVTDPEIGFGVTALAPPDGLLVAVAAAHLVTAPIGWATAVFVAFSRRRTLLLLVALAVVPLAAVVSLGVAMTDAWAWNTAAARASGTASTVVAATAVAAGPISLLGVLGVALRAERRHEGP